jgi:hypothetical protein
MHQPVKDNLEDYLKGVSGNYSRAVPPEMKTHLDSCGECAEELGVLAMHSAALRSLRAPGAPEPQAGFYARVMQRIDEARATNSVWAAFLEPIFARRLFYASATLLLVLGSYLVSTEAGEPGAAGANTPSATIAVITPSAGASATPDDSDGTTPQERDAVLVNLASFQQ